LRTRVARTRLAATLDPDRAPGSHRRLLARESHNDAADNWLEAERRMPMNRTLAGKVLKVLVLASAVPIQIAFLVLVIELATKTPAGGAA
jgi:hypothetical protein